MHTGWFSKVCNSFPKEKTVWLNALRTGAHRTNAEQTWEYLLLEVGKQHFLRPIFLVHPVDWHKYRVDQGDLQLTFTVSRQCDRLSTHLDTGCTTNWENNTTVKLLHPPCTRHFGCFHHMHSAFTSLPQAQKGCSQAWMGAYDWPTWTAEPHDITCSRRHSTNATEEGREGGWTQMTRWWWRRRRRRWRRRWRRRACARASPNRPGLQTFVMGNSSRATKIATEGKKSSARKQANKKIVCPTFLPFRPI